MNGRKLRAAALVLTLSGALLFLPPLVLVFATEQRLAGLPLGLVYLFAAWVAVIVAAGLLANRLPLATSSDEPG